VLTSYPVRKKLKMVWAVNHFRCALPSAYNSWSPWAWDWWPAQPEHDVIKAEKKQEPSKTADNEPAFTNQTTKNSWYVKFLLVNSNLVFYILPFYWCFRLQIKWGVTDNRSSIAASSLIFSWHPQRKVGARVFLTGYFVKIQNFGTERFKSD